MKLSIYKVLELHEDCNQIIEDINWLRADRDVHLCNLFNYVTYRKRNEVLIW